MDNSKKECMQCIIAYVNNSVTCTNNNWTLLDTLKFRNISCTEQEIDKYLKQLIELNIIEMSGGCYVLTKAGKLLYKFMQVL